MAANSDHAYEKFTKSSNRDALLAVADMIIVTFVISVFVGCFWGGTWILLDIYLLPENFELSAWTSFIIGNAVFIPATFFQEDILKFTSSFNKKYRFAKFFLISRLYSYILAIAGVNQWRGSAYLLMLYTGSSLTSELICILVGVISLCILQTFRSVIIPPLGTATDVQEEYHFYIQTRFCKPTRSIRFFLDTLFTILVINTCVVFFWKGAWLLLEIYIMPRDENGAMTTLLLIFFGFYVIPLVGQHWIRKFMKILDKESKLIKYIVKYLFLIFCSLLPIIFWQGVVLVQNYFIYNRSLLIGSIATHFVGFFGLVLLMATNSLIPRGCFLDAVNEFDVIFEVKYIAPVFEYYKGLRE